VFADLLIHTITIHNVVPGATDRYGNEIETFDAGASTPARVQQLKVGGQTREDLTGRDTRQTWFEVFAPPSVTVNGLSLIVWGTRRLQVDGEPVLVNDGDGPHHYQIMAREVLGG
jgi:hypothetical protein